jgi:hypothetical protein
MDEIDPTQCEADNPMLSERDMQRRISEYALMIGE